MAENEEKEIEEVDEDDDVIILQDENGNASKYLNQYNQGTLMSHEDALKEDEELMKEATRTK